MFLQGATSWRCFSFSKRKKSFLHKIQRRINEYLWYFKWTSFPRHLTSGYSMAAGVRLERLLLSLRGVNGNEKRNEPRYNYVDFVHNRPNVTYRFRVQCRKITFFSFSLLKSWKNTWMLQCSKCRVGTPSMGWNINLKNYLANGFEWEDRWRLIIKCETQGDGISLLSRGNTPCRGTVISNNRSPRGGTSVDLIRNGRTKTTIPRIWFRFQEIRKA